MFFCKVKKKKLARVVPGPPSCTSGTATAQNTIMIENGKLPLIPKV